MTSTKLRVLMLAAFMTGGFTAGAAYAGNCNDPWVTQAVTTVLKRPPSGPNAPECNIYLYKNGHWTSYNDLLGAVAYHWGTNPYPSQPSSPYGNVTFTPSASDFQVSAASLGYSRGSAPSVGSTVVYQGRTYQVARTIAQGGGNLGVELHLINHDGASVVGPGGASIVINQGSNYRRPGP